MSTSFYQFQAKKLNGQLQQMEDYKGKVILVVNTASQCGLTPQYEGLEDLYEKYKERGLVILGFPCNQFGNQEPGDEKTIKEGCVLNYGVSFPMFSKVEVNGANAHPLFVYLQNALPGFITNAIKWNFTKFLLDRNGQPYKRYSPITKPSKLIPDIEKLLG